MIVDTMSVVFSSCNLMLPLYVFAAFCEIWKFTSMLQVQKLGVKHSKK